MLLYIHVFFGVVGGLLFSIIGITGSLNLYSEEINAFLNPQFHIEIYSEKYLSLDLIMKNIRMAHPSRHNEWILQIPESTKVTITAWHEKTHETFDKYYAPLMVSINPYNGKLYQISFGGIHFSHGYTTYTINYCWAETVF